MHSRCGEAVLRSDYVELIQTEGRVVMVAEDDVTFRGPRAVYTLVVLQDVFRSQRDVAMLITECFAVTAFQLQPQLARLDLAVVSIFKCRPWLRIIVV